MEERKRFTIPVISTRCRTCALPSRDLWMEGKLAHLGLATMLRTRNLDRSDLSWCLRQERDRLVEELPGTVRHVVIDMHMRHFDSINAFLYVVPDPLCGHCPFPSCVRTADIIRSAQVQLHVKHAAKPNSIGLSSGIDRSQCSERYVIIRSIKCRCH